MERHRIAAICAASVLAVGIAFTTHEAAHAVAGWMAGGSPALLTATEVKGNFDALSPSGFVALGSAGFVVNLLLCGLGWWGLARKSVTPDFRLAAWFFFAVNGMLVSTATILEPALGWGDWMTILRHLPAAAFLRGLFAVLGVAGTLLVARRSADALATLVRPGDPRTRVAEARRIVLVGAAAAAVLVLGGSVANPVGTTRGILLGLGAGVGPFLPLMGSARMVRRVPSTDAAKPAMGRWPWLLAAGVVTAVMWFVVGPGIVL